MKRQMCKNGPPTLFLPRARVHTSNYIHDKVIRRLDAVMKHYPLGEFEHYKNAWKHVNQTINNHPSNLKRSGYSAIGFSKERYDAFVEFLYRVIDHIRQSINMLHHYEEAKGLRADYEAILNDPERLMQYYRQRYKNPSVQRFFSVSEQLGEMPVLKTKLIHYIDTTNEGIRPMKALKEAGSCSEAIEYVMREAHLLGAPICGISDKEKVPIKSEEEC
jgi:hypothetical protein